MFMSVLCDLAARSRLLYANCTAVSRHPALAKIDLPYIQGYNSLWVTRERMAAKAKAQMTYPNHRILDHCTGDQISLNL